MKGKNKDAAGSSTPTMNGTSAAATGSSSSSAANLTSQLSYPDITPVDADKHCPRFTSILNRAEGVGVGIEEMDSLQMEVERMLVNVIQRNRALTVESMILDSDPNESTIVINGNTLSKSMSMPQTPNEKQKMRAKNGGKPTPALMGSLVKTTSLLAAEAAQPIVRNDIPDTFWQSVEPYCADINEDDIRMLESQIDECDKLMHVNKLGPLGKHYSIQWSEEDLGHQMKEGARFADMDQPAAGGKPSAAQKRKLNETSSARKLALASSIFEQSMEKLKKPPPLPMPTSNGTSSCSSSTTSSSLGGGSGGISYGPLTQRLISALIEQNLMTPFDNEIADYLDRISPPESTCYISPRTMAKKCFTFPATTTSSSSTSHHHHHHNHHNHHSNTTSSSSGHIEKKIKRTLIEQGILDLEDERNGVTGGSAANEDTSTTTTSSTGPSDELTVDQLDKEDEIGCEIVSVQKELRMVAQHVKQSLVQLVELSRHNIAKQEIKRKIAAVDNEIIDTFERVQNARLAKTPLTKKEKDKAMKLIREREILHAQLKSGKTTGK